MLAAKNQILVKQELVEGTPQVFAGSDAIYAQDVDHTHDVDETEFSPVGNTLSKPSSLLGQRRATVTFGVDFKPGGASGGHPVAPPWDVPMRACGMRRWQLYEINIGAITSGPIAHLAAYTATGGSAGFIIGSYLTGVPKILYWATNRIAIGNGATITVGSASCTSSSVSTANGYLYAPASSVFASANRGAWTGTPTVGEMVKGGTSGGVAQLLDAGSPLGGAGDILVDPIPSLAALANLDVITGQSSGATCTLSSGAALIENYSVAMQYLIDGMGFTLYGARGNWKFDWKTGQVGKIDFGLTGFELATSDTPLLGGTSYNTTMPPRLVSANATIDAVTLAVAGVSCDMQNVEARTPDWNTPEGARVTRIANRNPVGTLDFDLVPKAAYDFWTKWRAGTTVPLKIRLGTAENAPFGAIGSGLWIDAPAVQYRKPKVGNRDGQANVNWDIAFRRQTDAGDNELFIICL